MGCSSCVGRLECHSGSGDLAERSRAPVGRKHRPAFMIAPYAVDFDKPAQDAVAREAKRAHECRGTLIVWDDVCGDSVQPALFKCVVDECCYGIAHEPLAGLAGCEPISNIAVEVRPFRDASEGADPHDSLIFPRTDQQSKPPTRVTIWLQHPSESSAE